MRRLYPEHWLFNSGLAEEDGMIVYRQEIETEALKKIGELCEPYIDSDKVFAYSSFTQDS